MPVPRPMEDSTPRPNHHTMNKAHSSAAATPPCDVPAPVQYPMKFEFSSAAQGVLWKCGKQLRTPLRNDQGCGVVLCCEVWDGWYPSRWRSCRLVLRGVGWMVSVSLAVMQACEPVSNDEEHVPGTITPPRKGGYYVVQCYQ